MDSSFTLLLLDESMKKISNDFCFNIRKFHPFSFPISLRIGLWKTFIRSIFDYNLLAFSVFNNKIKLIGQHYFKTLKAACGLPKQVSHSMLLSSLRLRTPRRTAILYFHRVAHKVRKRMMLPSWPNELLEVWNILRDSDRFTLESNYRELEGIVDELEFGLKHKDDVDLLKFVNEFNHLLLRGSLGVLFDLRTHLNFKQLADLNCKACNSTRGTQKHFLDECPQWQEQRDSFRASYKEALDLIGSPSINDLMINLRSARYNINRIKGFVSPSESFRELKRTYARVRHSY